MIYFADENKEIKKSGIYVYRWSDKASAGFYIVRKHKWRQNFRWSKNAKKFFFTTIVIDQKAIDEFYRK